MKNITVYHINIFRSYESTELYYRHCRSAKSDSPGPLSTINYKNGPSAAKPSTPDLFEL